MPAEDIMIAYFIQTLTLWIYNLWCFVFDFLVLISLKKIPEWPYVNKCVQVSLHWWDSTLKKSANSILVFFLAENIKTKFFLPKVVLKQNKHAIRNLYSKNRVVQMLISFYFFHVLITFLHVYIEKIRDVDIVYGNFK